MADNIFNQRLRQANGSAANIGVAENKGSEYAAIANAVGSVANVVGSVGNQLLGSYQAEQANKELESELNALNVEQDEASSKILAGARDELELEALKQEQGVISEQQKQNRINTIINKHMATANSSAREKLEGLRSQYSGSQSYTNKKVQAQSMRQKAEDDAIAAALTEREKLSVSLYGKTTKNLNEKQFNALVGHEEAINQTEVLKKQAEFEKYKFEKANYSQKSKDLYAEREFASISNSYNNELFTGFSAINESLALDQDLTDLEFNASIVLVNTQKENVKQRMREHYQKSFGTAIPQTELDKIDKQAESFITSINGYKNLTVEQRQKVSLNNYKTAAELQKTQAEINQLNINNTNTLLKLYENGTIQYIEDAQDSDEAYRVASTVLGKDAANQFIVKDVNGKTSFDNKGFVQEFMWASSNILNGKFREQRGNARADAMFRAIAITPNFMMSSSDTNLLNEGGTLEPQTDAIKETSDRHRQKADEIKTQAGQVNSDSLNWVNAGLSYLTSNNFKLGAPNTERAAYKAKTTTEEVNKGLVYAREYIKQNPDSIYITETGQVKTDSPEVNEMLSQAYHLHGKINKVPGYEEALTNELVNYSNAAIDIGIVEPMVNAIKENLNRPEFAKASVATKQEMLEDIVKSQREFQQAQALKNKNATQTKELANALVGKPINSRSILDVAGQLNAVTENNAIGELAGIGQAVATDGNVAQAVAQSEALRGLAYLGLTTQSVSEKAKAWTETAYEKFFGESIEEQVEEQFDKRYGVKTTQAKILRQIEDSKLPAVQAVRIVNEFTPKLNELVDKELFGGSLNEQEAYLKKYFTKAIDLVEKKYADALIESTTENIDIDLGETNLSAEAQAITEELIEDPTPIVVSEEEAIQEQIDEGVNPDEIQNDI